MSWTQSARAGALRLLHLEWVLIGILFVSLTLSILELALVSVVGGKDLQADRLIGEHAPLRDLLEFFYFVANCSLAVVALLALRFARKQAEESENTRLASVYSQLEQRWSSAAMLECRAMFRDMMTEYQQHRTDEAHNNRQPLDLAEFFDRELLSMQRSDFRRYLQFMGIVDYLEAIGMFEANGFVNLHHLEPLMGEMCVYAYDILSSHIATVRVAVGRQTQSNGYTSVPDAYASFEELARKFDARFRRAAASTGTPRL
jgi:hypothetical protein